LSFFLNSPFSYVLAGFLESGHLTMGIVFPWWMLFMLNTEVGRR